MLRILLQFVLPLIFPTALYLVWAWFEQRRNKTAAEDDRATPWIWLISIGFALSIISLVTWGIVKGDDPGTTYTAPRMEDGKVIPGKFK